MFDPHGTPYISIATCSVLIDNPALSVIDVAVCVLLQANHLM